MLESMQQVTDLHSVQIAMQGLTAALKDTVHAQSVQLDSMQTAQALPTAPCAQLDSMQAAQAFPTAHCVLQEGTPTPVV